jgi:hypothetical protein
MVQFENLPSPSGFQFLLFEGAAGTVKIAVAGRKLILCHNQKCH